MAEPGTIRSNYVDRDAWMTGRDLDQLKLVGQIRRLWVALGVTWVLTIVQIFVVASVL